MAQHFGLICWDELKPQRNLTHALDWPGILIGWGGLLLTNFGLLMWQIHVYGCCLESINK